MKGLDNQLHRKVLLALRSYLRGEVSSFTDMMLHVALDRRAPRPSGICLTCSPVWRKARARTLKDFISGLIEQRQDLLDKIEAALERLRDGDYGICEDCEMPIPEGWLLAVPYTTLCASCDSQKMLC